MASGNSVDLRPRTAGEILDDAWRLYFADLPVLLALSGLFLVPVSVALLLLLTRTPESLAARAVLPALTALLLPLTGIGSGACQEVFLRRADGRPVSLSGCLGAALRCGLEHAAARALVLAGAAVGLVLLVVTGLGVWVSTTGVHPVLASGRGRLFDAFREAAGEAQRSPGRVAAVAVGRAGTFLFALVNLQVFLFLVLWVGNNVVGLDLAFVGAVLSVRNPVYVVALLLLTGLLLAPYGEACNYLLHVDGRVRYEGLDLWYRVRHHLSTAERGRAGAAVVALAALLLLAAPGRADDAKLEAVQAARQEVAAVRGEAEKAEPWPGGGRWAGRLRAAGERLKQAGGGPAGRHAWYDRAVTEFAKNDKEDALKTLDTLDRRLAYMEEGLKPPPADGCRLLTPEEVRETLPGKAAPEKLPKGDKKDAAKKQDDKDVKKPEERDRPGGQGGAAAGPGDVAALGAVAALARLFFLLFVGLILAIFAVAIVMFVRQWQATRPKQKPPETGRAAPAPEAVRERPDQFSPAEWWQQADDLARAGNFLEGVRRLYLGVLALLNRADLIRYERTRTNGEYVQQVRLAPTAPPAVHQAFRQLTNLFELKWYGERACAEEDFHACRALAEEIRGEVPI
ncbi:MAG TPA: DUF4129 domain-containing protein [Gemmataceae bacterium]|nr:DUF4129 domain-containing protein [Gemmataceae bacterium]